MVLEYHHQLAQVVSMTQERTVSCASANVSEKVHKEGVGRLRRGPVLLWIAAGIKEFGAHDGSVWAFYSTSKSEN